MTTNFSVRPSDMRDPVVGARRMNELFRALQSQIDDLDGNRLIENIAFHTTNPVGNTFPLKLPQISEGVKGLIIIKFATATGGQAAPAGLSWSSRPLGATPETGLIQTAVQIDYIAGLAVDTDYVMSLKVING